LLNKIHSYITKLWREDPFSDPDKDGYFDSGMWAADRKRKQEAEAANTPPTSGWTFDQILLKPGVALSELSRLELEQYVPGQWHCDKCKFSLYQRTLNAHDGSVSVRDDEPDPCPNCKTVMRRFTWKERAYEAEDMLADAYAERNKALASGTPAVNAFIGKVAQVATDVGFGAGEPASELAGHVISVLAGSPECTERFLEVGVESFIDGTFAPENGTLTYRSRKGDILHPSVLREQKGMQQ